MEFPLDLAILRCHIYPLSKAPTYPSLGHIRVALGVHVLHRFSSPAPGVMEAKVHSLACGADFLQTTVVFSQPCTMALLQMSDHK